MKFIFQQKKGTNIVPDPNYFMNYAEDFTKTLNSRVDELFKVYIIDLEKETHVGDCTCYPMSCSKSHAEEILGINTLYGLNKHGGHQIFRYFHDNPNANLEKLIENLKNYEPKATWEGWEQHAERWKQEANELAYKI